MSAPGEVTVGPRPDGRGGERLREADPQAVAWLIRNNEAEA